MGWLTDMVLGTAAVVSAPVWGVKMLRTGKHRTDWAGRLGRMEPGVLARLTPRRAGQPRVLIHAVSVGEANLLRPLVARLEAEHPEVELVIAVTTDTGLARAQSLYAQRHAVVRYPLDFSAAVGRFLDGVKPDVVALVELEVWPNLIEACGKRAVPVAVINGRLSERSFKGYRKIKRLIGPSFASLRLAAVQTEAYAARFRHMGVRDVRVLDTMKWDAARVEPGEVEGASALAAALGLDRDRPIVVLGSSAVGEESLLTKGLPEGAQLVVAPRKPEWFDEVARALPGVVRRTDHPLGSTRGIDPSSRFFLLDTIGELRAAYSLANVAVVGRSFLGMYGSDVMEPAALGKPVVIGPYHGDFQDTVDAMRAAGGLVVASDPREEVVGLLSDPARAATVAEAGLGVILSRQGSADRHVAVLRELWESSVESER